jgi:hypothetical protein
MKSFKSDARIPEARRAFLLWFSVQRVEERLGGDLEMVRLVLRPLGEKPAAKAIAAFCD